MSISDFKGGSGYCPVDSPEAMLRTIKDLGLVPFFENPVRGYSIEELTAEGCWFDDEEGELGPWDWKIDVIQTGDIAYGKFLVGGKASFATVDWYRELMGYRRSLDKCRPKGLDKEVYDAIAEAGTISPAELRKFFKLKKAQIDSILTRLEYDTLVVVGDITRVYRGANLHYNGWQRSSVCTPDALFEITPSTCPDPFGRLFSHIRGLFPDATDAQVRKIIV